VHHAVLGGRNEDWKSVKTYSLLLLDGGGALSASLLLALALLEEGLGDEDLVLGRDGTRRARQIST
jgi:hypothetical protein